jgi:hypothetical protein
MSKRIKNNFVHVNFKNNSSYTVQKKTHQGKSFIVVPVTMMVEGVHHGSLGPLLHTIDELGKYPASWDGIPVVIDHPQVNGVYVSANSPDIIDTRTVGRVYNTHVDGSKLKAEAWLEEDSLNRISESTLEQVNATEMIEVSVGVFTDNEDVTGDWNGEQYNAIARNHRPDHLALLPGGTGACSIEDGCGIRVNKKGGINVEEVKIKDAIKLLSNSNFSISEINVNDDGYNVIMEAIRRKVDGMDNATIYNYVEEVYDNYFIYCSRSRDAGGSKLFRQGYLMVDDQVNLVGDPIEVIKKVDIQYTPINNNSTMKRTKFNNNKEVTQMNNECGQCMEKVVAIINSNSTPYTKEHREWLLTQSEDFLNQILPSDYKKLEVNTTTTTAAPVAVTTEQILNALNSMKPEDRVKLYAEEDRNALTAFKKQIADKRTAMITGIQANTSKEQWPDAELVTMSDSQLERLFQSTKKAEVETMDYSLNGNSNFSANRTKEEFEPLYPTGIEMEIKK